MNWLVGIAVIVLMALSVFVGRVIAGERVEEKRKRLAAKGWDLWLWEQELINVAELRGCPSCTLLRRRAELHRHAPEE